jgi:hypothetical protein
MKSLITVDMETNCSPEFPDGSEDMIAKKWPNEIARRSFQVLTKRFMKLKNLTPTYFSRNLVDHF